MICAYLVRSTVSKKNLVISRGHQLKLSFDLELLLGYIPFLYNSSEGMYFFIDHKDCNEKLEQWLCDNINGFTKTSFEVIATHSQSRFFQKTIAGQLTDKKGSALAWKRTISSFLTQLKPFQGETKSVYNLFLCFVEIVKKTGNKAQLDYLKRKMNQLRTRVPIHKDTLV